MYSACHLGDGNHQPPFSLTVNFLGHCWVHTSNSINYWWIERGKKGRLACQDLLVEMLKSTEVSHLEGEVKRPAWKPAVPFLVWDSITGRTDRSLKLLCGENRAPCPSPETATNNTVSSVPADPPTTSIPSAAPCHFMPT